MKFDAVLNHLGVIKNQMLIFGIIGAVAFLIAASFIKGDIKQGFCLLIAAICMLGSMAFYMYAIIKLPGSRQELMFSQNAAVDIKEHYAKEAA